VRNQMLSIRTAFAIATLLLGTGCHTMARLSWEDVAGQRPSRVWITQADQSVVELSGPQIFGDTLVGYVRGEFMELPTAAVQRVVVRRPALARTVALIAVSTAGAAAVAVWMSGLGPQPAPDDPVDCLMDPDHPDCQ